MALLDNAARLPAPAEIGRILAREGIRAELTPVARKRGARGMRPVRVMRRKSFKGPTGKDRMRARMR